MAEIRPEQYQLVFFFEGTEISRQMLVEEFESVLDGFVPLPDYSGRRCQCVYLLVNPDLSLDAAVFFHLSFDISGRPDLHWNTPIKQLASQAGATHPLNADIRIASYSNCSIAWHQQKLWEPFAEQLDAISVSLSGNPLGLGAINRSQSSTSEIPALHINESQEPLVLTNLADFSGHGLTESELEKQRRLFEYQINLKNLELGKLRDQHNGLLLQLRSLEGQFEKNLQESVKAKVEARDRQWKDKLGKTKLYMQQQARLIREQETQLKALADKEAVEAGVDNNVAIFKHMASRGIKLQVSHPGIGSVHIPYDDVLEYMAAPVVYIAGLCDMSAEDYAAWLQHRHNPRCLGFNEDGTACGVSVDLISELEQFVPGESDHCVRHRVLKDNQSSIA